MSVRNYTCITRVEITKTKRKVASTFIGIPFDLLYRNGGGGGHVASEYIFEFRNFDTRNTFRITFADQSFINYDLKKKNRLSAVGTRYLKKLRHGLVAVRIL